MADRLLSRSASSRIGIDCPGSVPTLWVESARHATRLSVSVARCSDRKRIAAAEPMVLWSRYAHTHRGVEKKGQRMTDEDAISSRLDRGKVHFGAPSIASADPSVERPRLVNRVLVSSLLLAVLFIACGPDVASEGGGESSGSSASTTAGSTPFALVATSPASLAPGERRIMVGLVDPESNEWLASSDLTATVTVSDENGSPLDSYPTEFLWTVPEVRGLYVAYVDLPEAGNFQLTVDADGYATTEPAQIIVVEDPTVVLPGDPAPMSETRTTAEYPDLSVISTDPDPDPAMYDRTVAEAVSDGTPAVVVFASPGFCVSQTCGPILEQVKSLRPDFPGVDFVHVEVYEDLQVQSFDDLTPVEATSEWGLPSEPWVFVVDSDGVVSASFEGAVSEEELTAAIRNAGS